MFFWNKEILAPPRAFRLAKGHAEHTLSAQSVFCEVHAAAKNEWNLLHGLRAVNSARLLG